MYVLSNRVIFSLQQDSVRLEFSLYVKGAGGATKPETPHPRS